MGSSNPSEEDLGRLRSQGLELQCRVIAVNDAGCISVVAQVDGDQWLSSRLNCNSRETRLCADWNVSVGSANENKIVTARVSLG
jgi:hypothetical protein